MGRLIAALGNCGRVMAALPDKEETSMEVEEGVKDAVGEKEVPSKESGKDLKSGQGKGGEKAGGGGKKKKGKR